MSNEELAALNEALCIVKENILEDCDELVVNAAQAYAKHADTIAAIESGEYAEKAYTALENWPCAGMGEKKRKEVMAFVNTHQSALIKGLEILSGKTRSEAIKSMLAAEPKIGGE